MLLELKTQHLRETIEKTVENKGKELQSIQKHLLQLEIDIKKVKKVEDTKKEVVEDVEMQDYKPLR